MAKTLNKLPKAFLKAKGDDAKKGKKKKGGYGKAKRMSQIPFGRGK